jgi:hypothetical protein
LLYHVPRSQVWEGSRGRQRGHFHIHVTERLFSPPLVRNAGYSLCGKAGWYETDDLVGRPGVTICPTCLKRAERYGVEIPEPPSRGQGGPMPDLGQSGGRVVPWYHLDGEQWVYGVSQDHEPLQGGFADTERRARSALRALLWQFGYTRDEAQKAVRQIHGR